MQEILFVSRWFLNRNHLCVQQVNITKILHLNKTNDL